MNSPIKRASDMKPLPEDPFAFQRRVMTAMMDDILDMGARRSTRFERLDALREVSRRILTGEEHD